MLKYYTNGKHDIRIDSTSCPPKGYVLGRMNVFHSSGYYWINNGEEEKTIPKHSDIPEGFSRGRLPRSVETSEKQKNTLLNNKQQWFNNGILEISLKQNEVVPEGFTQGRLPMKQSQKDKLSKAHTGLHQTPETIQKIKCHSNNNRLKSKQTCLSTYGVEHVFQVPEILEKANQTKRKNKTFNSSKPEEKMFTELVENFGKHNIKRHYKDKDRYPFYCDFYIVSEDLFIELNAHWTHGGRRFDSDDLECRKQLNEWELKAKTSQFYAEAIKTWTIRDVKKFEYAEKNNLNYKVIYEF